MRVISFSKEIIRNEILSFSLDEKIEPNFFNAGTSVAYIQGIAIPPGSSFQAGVSNAIMKGTLEIKFAKDSEAPSLSFNSTNRAKHLICFFGRLISDEKVEEKTYCK
jgi:hypothetical protein